MNYAPSMFWGAQSLDPHQLAANSEVMMRVVAELANTSTWCEHNVLVLSTWMKVPTMGTGFNFGWLVGVWEL